MPLIVFDNFLLWFVALEQTFNVRGQVYDFCTPVTVTSGSAQHLFLE
jgi:hypothetical protein